MMNRGVVQVELNEKHRPMRFNWHSKDYHVRSIQECWRLMGAWWNDEGEQTFFRIQTTEGGTYELCFDHAKSEWRMSRIYD